jgi:hypothetical protein
MIGKKLMAFGCALLCGVFVFAAPKASAEDDMFRFDQIRPNQVEWDFIAGRGETRYITDNTSVPKMDFDVYGLRYAHFISSKSQVGYSLMVGEQTTQGRNTGISTFIDYSQMIHRDHHFAISYELGIGVMRFKDKVPGQGSRTNFNERAAISFHWATGHETALSVSVGMYHASNAGLQVPNPGVNVGLLLVSQNWYQ